MVPQRHWEQLFHKNTANKKEHGIRVSTLDSKLKDASIQKLQGGTARYVRLGAEDFRITFPSTAQRSDEEHTRALRERVEQLEATLRALKNIEKNDMTTQTEDSPPSPLTQQEANAENAAPSFESTAHLETENSFSTKKNHFAPMSATMRIDGMLERQQHGLSTPAAPFADEKRE